MSYNPWLDAHRRHPDIHIEWHDLAPTRAAWVPSERIILVDESISRAERRCALAHELAHIDTGDLATEACWYSARQETGADKLAARRLIDAHDLAAVVRWTQDSREIAEALEVTLSVLALRHKYMAPWERGLVWQSVSRRVAVA